MRCWGVCRVQDTLWGRSLGAPGSSLGAPGSLVDEVLGAMGFPGDVFWEVFWVDLDVWLFADPFPFLDAAVAASDDADVIPVVVVST